jgi:hypothetical protein
LIIVIKLPQANGLKALVTLFAPKLKGAFCGVQVFGFYHLAVDELTGLNESFALGVSKPGI